MFRSFEKIKVYNLIPFARSLEYFPNNSLAGSQVIFYFRYAWVQLRTLSMPGFNSNETEHVLGKFLNIFADF